MSERINFGDLMMIVIISIDLRNLLKVNCHISYLKELPISINLLNFSCKLKILFFIAVRLDSQNSSIGTTYKKY